MARRSGPTRTKQWLAAPGLAVAGQAEGRFFGSGGGQFGDPGTILRCRSDIVFSTFAGAVADDVTVSMGLAIVSAAAFAAGAVSCPDASNTSFPWLWWKAVTVIAQTTAREQPWGVSNHHIELDSKAMRKVKATETLVMCVELGSTAGVALMDWGMGQIRILVAK